MYLSYGQLYHVSTSWYISINVHRNVVYCFNAYLTCVLVFLSVSGVGPKPRQTPRIVAGPQNVTVSLHHTVVLECIATGNPRPIISWSRADSKPIDVYNARVLGR